MNPPCRKSKHFWIAPHPLRPKREFNILFSGGEPTISPHFLEAIKYASGIGLKRLHVATNGIRFAEDADFARAARAAGLHGVFLQIDGMTEEKNAHRGIANYLDVKLKAIENISAAGMRVTLQVTVINGVNNDALGPIVEFAAKHSKSIFGVLFQPIMFSGRDEQVDDETRYRKRYTLSQLATICRARPTRTGSRSATGGRWPATASLTRSLTCSSPIGIEVRFS